ncbi:prolyl aminopeptidase [Mycetohabitans endofungorum]|uniref:Proline iminopeptidase n=2 Tax=Burkholderiaceae TaxID=119060 RepID=A0A2P5K7J1_9BURK|nr:prolyl aminopeptidase [Mycetohabitans endofungorum]
MRRAGNAVPNTKFAKPVMLSDTLANPGEPYMDNPSKTAQKTSDAEGMLDVGNGHSIYWRELGDPQAQPIVVLHGGPGGAMSLGWADHLDATRWRIVFFDQRGCGRSTPFGELEHNGIVDLVSDIEKLREHLRIERWAVFGGSWGTTLALAYGSTHPQRCSGFLLRGVYLAREQDTDWFLWDVRRLYPDLHAAFLDAIEKASGQRPASARDVLALTQAPLARFDATGIELARAWHRYETTLSVIRHDTVPGQDPVPEDTQARAAIAMALLERHYMADELPPSPPLLTRVSRIAHLPCHIVHGRFDMVCPADQAYALAAAWPRARLSLVDAAGHWTFDPGISAGLREAASRLRADLAG